MQYSERPLQVDAARVDIDADSVEDVDTEVDVRCTSVLVSCTASAGWKSRMMLSTARFSP